MTDVLDRFLEQARLHPDKVAVSENGRLVSYAELHRHAAAIAAGLAPHGAHPKVLILLDQGWLAYSAILAVLIAGGIYAPINTQAPVEKIELIARQFQPDVVLTTAAVRSRFAAFDSAGTFIDVEAPESAPLAAPRPAHELMYVMFTSGSTGVPKGVMIRRDSMAHFIAWVIDTVKPTPEDRWSQHPNIAFDMSHLDIFGCLGSGGTLVPFNTQVDRLMPAKKIKAERVTLWYSVPSVVNMMMQARQLTADNLASLRLMNFAGEALLPEQLDAVFAARPDLEVWNTYGPTEATVTVTLLRLHAHDYRSHCRASASIGAGIPGMKLVLQNGTHADEGEIVILGPQLAVGYWQSDELTGKAFREVELDGRRQRGYFTGDWGQREGENIYFVGRIDNQVKIRGVRLELGEVEAALRRCGYRDAIVVLHENRLHAFLESDAQTVDDVALAARLAEILVPQGIPSSYHLVPTFPRNANDKVDRGALRATLTKAGNAAGER